MKKTLLVSLLFLFTFKINAQLIWQPLSTGVNQGVGVRVNAFTIYNNKLIVGGSFKSAGGNITDNIAVWDGSNWSVLLNGVQSGTLQNAGCSSQNGVYALTSFQGNLIVGGLFGSANTTTLCGLAKWNGNAWSSIVNKLVSNNFGPGIIKALTVYNNKLIAAGAFDTINGVPARNIAQWDGVTWSPLGSGINIIYNGYHRFVEALTIYNNELYAGGSFTFSAQGNVVANNVAKWNGSTWSALGTGIPDCLGIGGASFSGVTSLCAFNNNIYAANCVNGISMWNGSNWSTVGGSMPLVGEQAFTLTIFDNKLIVGGVFTQVGLQNMGCISAWDGSNWHSLGTSTITNLNGIGSGGSIKALITYGSQLYVGGNITYAESNNPVATPLNNIARFTNSTIGVKEYSLNNPVKILPNPSTDKFTFEGLDGNSFIEVTDITGKQILIKETNEKFLNISLHNHSQGIYFYKVKNKDGVIQSGKLILEK
jgi:hypothetical protein